MRATRSVGIGAAAVLAGCSAAPPPPPAEPIAIVETNAAVVATGEAPIEAAPLDDLAGRYEIAQGVNPDGSRYDGTVEILRTGEAYRLGWTVGDATYGGVAIRQGDLLAVGWGPPTSHGVVVYRVEGGSLRGKWASAQSGEALGIEDLDGPPGLDGTYTIVRSSPPGGGDAYPGTVEIHPDGGLYRLDWRIATETYQGIGMVEDDWLVVGWGTGDVGAVVYRVTRDALDGRWVGPDGSGIGREVLVRDGGGARAAQLSVPAP